MVEDDEMICQTQHCLHGVLDDHDGDVGFRERADDPDHLVDLGRPEAGEDLVQEQNLWIAGQRAG